MGDKPKFRFVHFSVFDGAVFGLNDEAKAKDWAESEDDFVVDLETMEWLHADGSRIPLAETLEAYRGDVNGG